MSKKLLTKSEMAPGAVAEGGSMAALCTGTWRTYAPLTDFEKCTHCLICWSLCPDSAIVVKNGKKLGTNYQYCKGCGICATECPAECIQMKLETDVTEEEKNNEQPRERD
jgi:2-oxoacid:acceptor oxidoreductase delta subunit (pyruvate/2-ketoisovalerate family)